jgi:uncharacterized protein YjbI with pentapeptide repeats
VASTSGAVIIRNQLVCAQFKFACLDQAKFDLCPPDGANFVSPSLANPSLRNAALEYADFTGANLEALYGRLGTRVYSSAPVFVRFQQFAAFSIN